MQNLIQDDIPNETKTLPDGGFDDGAPNCASTKQPTPSIVSDRPIFVVFAPLPRQWHRRSIG